MPYPESDRIVQVISNRKEGAATIRAASVARPFILGLTERNRSFASVGKIDSFSKISRRRLTMTFDGQFGAAELRGTRISPVLFSMLGAHSQLGRLFVPGDEQPERNELIILSDRAWRSQYLANTEVVGSSTTIDGRSDTVAGIMSSGFTFPDAQTDFWIPLMSAPVPPRGHLASAHRSRAMGRQGAVGAGWAHNLVYLQPRQRVLRCVGHRVRSRDRHDGWLRVPRHTTHGSRAAATGHGALGTRGQRRSDRGAYRRAIRRRVDARHP